MEYKQYVLGKQTLAQLEDSLLLSKPTLQKHFDSLKLTEFTPKPSSVHLVIDATYFGKKKDKDGVLIAKDSFTGRIVYYKFIESETTNQYQLLRNHLESTGFTIVSVTIDGRPGVKSVFQDLPLQMCQFHLMQIVNRYLTKKPKLLPSKQLKTIVDSLPQSNQNSFKARFEYWLEVNSEFLNQKTFDPVTKRYHYTHKRLRSAVKSIQRNLPYVFTYQESNFTGIKQPEILAQYLATKTKLNSRVEHTTNCLDGWFAHLRKLLNCHNGLRKDRKHKMIERIIRN